jgi:hypothetical protein
MDRASEEGVPSSGWCEWCTMGVGADDTEGEESERKMVSYLRMVSTNDRLKHNNVLYNDQLQIGLVRDGWFSKKISSTQIEMLMSCVDVPFTPESVQWHERSVARKILGVCRFK